jgi:hypothetical protein
MTTHRGAEQFLMRSPYRTLECWTTRLELTVMEPE